jgi:hypothetical protein
MQCLPNCQFIHPSDPAWDRAPAPVRGRGGPPQGGRGRGQSSFGPPATGANSSALSQEWGNSSGTWGEYLTDFDRNPRATSGLRGVPPRRSGQTRSESSGWGSSGADGPGWGSSANNNETQSNRSSNVPVASGEQSLSQSDTTASGWGPSGNGWGSSGNEWGSSGNEWGSSGNEWGSSGNEWGSSGNEWGSSGNGWGSSGNGLESSGNAPGPSGNGLKSSGNGWGPSGNEFGSGSGWGSTDNAWGSAGTDQGPGWGETSISDQGTKASSATTVAKIAEPDAVLGGNGVNGDSDAATATTRSSRVSVSVAPAFQNDIQESGCVKPVRVAIPSIPTSGELSGELDPAHNEERGEDTFEPATVEPFR